MGRVFAFFITSERGWSSFRRAQASQLPPKNKNSDAEDFAESLFTISFISMFLVPAAQGTRIEKGTNKGKGKKGIEEKKMLRNANRLHGM